MWNEMINSNEKEKKNNQTINKVNPCSDLGSISAPHEFKSGQKIASKKNPECKLQVG